MKLCLRVVVSVGLLTLIFLVLPWEGVREAVLRMSWGVWFGVLCVFVAGHGLGMVKWRLMVNVGRGGLESGAAARCYSAGLFTNLCLPSLVGGDLLRAALAGKTTGRGEAVLLGALTDRLIDVMSLGVLIAAGGLASRAALPDVGSGIVTALVLTGVGAAVIVPFLVSRVPLARWPKRVRRSVGRGLVGVRRLVQRPGPAAAAFGLSLVMQTSFVLANAVLGHQIGIDVPLAVWFFAWPLAKVAALLPISIGGLAVREATLAALLVPFGVEPARGVVVSLAWQTVVIGGGLSAGVVWWLMSREASGAEGDGAREEAGVGRSFRSGHGLSRPEATGGTSG